MFSLEANFQAFTPFILSAIEKVFLEEPHSAFLYFFEGLVDKFYENEAMLPTIKQSFALLSSVTLQHLPNSQAFFNDQDLGEDFLAMNYMVIKKLPALFLEEQASVQTLQTSLELLELRCYKQSLFALKIMKGLVLAAVEQKIQFDSIKLIFDQIGEQLVNALVDFILDCPTESILDLIKILLGLLAEHCGKAQIIATKVDSLPSDILTQMEKKRFFEVLDSGMIDEFDRQLHHLSRRAVARLNRMQ